MGFLLLAGGSEFGGRMAEPDRLALERAGGPAARVRVIPAAAAPDRNTERAGRNAVRWFRGLGARDVDVVPLIDRASAQNATVATELERSNLIYLLGGFTHYLGQTLAGSASERALRAAHAAGAVLAGSSAGAMVLCEQYWDPAAGELQPGLGFVPGTCFIPHHDTFGRSWPARLGPRLPGLQLIGVDEQTGMLDDGTGRTWHVAGRGRVTVYQSGAVRSCAAGERLELDAG